MHSSKRLLALLSLAAAAAPAAASPVAIGPTYPVQEPDMLEWIEQTVADKVASGEVQRYQERQAARIQRQLENPAPLQTVTRAVNNRTLYHDTTFTVTKDVLDDRGRVLVAAGTTINPLDRVSLSRPLIFFDAREPVQVAFVRRYLDTREGLAKPILVGGSYFDLMQRWRSPVYFDQHSILVRRLGIRHVPAIVVQEGKRLRIDEIAL